MDSDQTVSRREACLLTAGAAVTMAEDVLGATSAAAESKLDDYRFDRRMSRKVLESYLSRSISMEGLLNGRGDFDDNVRMLKSTGAKFIGRALCLWGGEANWASNHVRAKSQIPLVHAADPEMILQACVFEIVTKDVEQIPVPDWAFTAFGMPVENRMFRYTDMIFTDKNRRNWGPNASVPDVSRPETKLWFYFQARSYIDIGIEAIHFGQVELMGRNDSDRAHWEQLLTLVRAYAGKRARRHMVLCDGHVPSGGMVRVGKLLLDFHSFPLRIKEAPDHAQTATVGSTALDNAEAVDNPKSKIRVPVGTGDPKSSMPAILELGFSDGIYGRSKGGITPGGWKCDHLPYLVEIDNWGASKTPGKSGAGGIWVWGYDEITWFAHQSLDYRAAWLRYAWDWVRRTDPNGMLQMPGSRTMRSPLDHKNWYYANNPGPSVPDGLGDEAAIKAIWDGNR